MTIGQRAGPRRGVAQIAPKSRRGVVELHRSRLITSAIATAEEEGFRGISVAKLVDRAGVGRKAFYACFRNSEDCFLAALEQTLGHGRQLLATAYASGGPDRWKCMRTAVLGLLTSMERDRGLAKLCVVETLAAGRPVLIRRAQALEELAQAIDRHGPPTGSPRDPRSLAPQAIVGGVTHLLHRRLSEGDPAPLTDLYGPTMSMIVMPYQGSAAARRELRDAPSSITRSVQSILAFHDAAVPDPLEGAGLRLTYRTARVLVAIAEMPGASNRRVAGEAGIGDQGQMSKLLRRLARADLIENQGVGHVEVGANAWHLTERGAALRRAVDSSRAFV